MKDKPEKCYICGEPAEPGEDRCAECLKVFAPQPLSAGLKYGKKFKTNKEKK